MTRELSFRGKMRMKRKENLGKKADNGALLTHICQRYFVNFSYLSTPPQLPNITVELSMRQTSKTKCTHCEHCKMAN